MDTFDLIILKIVRKYKYNGKHTPISFPALDRIFNQEIGITYSKEVGLYGSGLSNKVNELIKLNLLEKTSQGIILTTEGFEKVAD